MLDKSSVDKELARDSSGAVIPGAKVEILSQETGLRPEVLSNEGGTYSFPLLPIGSYTVTASHSGMRTVSMKDLKLAIGDNRTLDIAMQVSVSEVSVTVQDPNPRGIHCWSSGGLHANGGSLAYPYLEVEFRLLADARFPITVGTSPVAKLRFWHTQRRPRFRLQFEPFPSLLLCCSSAGWARRERGMLFRRWPDFATERKSRCRNRPTQADRHEVLSFKTSNSDFAGIPYPFSSL